MCLKKNKKSLEMKIWILVSVVIIIGIASTAISSYVYYKFRNEEVAVSINIIATVLAGTIGGISTMLGVSYTIKDSNQKMENEMMRRDEEERKQREEKSRRVALILLTQIEYYINSVRDYAKRSILEMNSTNRCINKLENPSLEKSNEKFERKIKNLAWKYDICFMESDCRKLFSELVTDKKELEAYVTNFFELFKANQRTLRYFSNEKNQRVVEFINCMKIECLSDEFCNLIDAIINAKQSYGEKSIEKMVKKFDGKEAFKPYINEMMDNLKIMVE